MTSVKRGNFTFLDTSIQGVKIVESRVFEDDRGYFAETYKYCDFAEGGVDCTFVQDNQSSSTAGVLRGLHYQINYPQAKLVRVVAGEVFDVAVDLREDSPTFGKWEGVILSAENKRQFFVPRGFAHGFLVLSDRAEFVYKCDDVYHAGDEGGIIFDDSDIAIDWPFELIRAGFEKSDLILSEKDRNQISLNEFKKLSLT